MKFSSTLIALAILAAANAQSHPPMATWSQAAVGAGVSGGVAFKNPISKAGIIALGGSLGGDMLRTGLTSFIGESISTESQPIASTFTQHRAAGDVMPGTTSFIAVGGCYDAYCTSHAPNMVMAATVVPMTGMDVSVHTMNLQPAVNETAFPVRYWHAATFANMFEPDASLYVHGGYDQSHQAMDGLMKMSFNLQNGTYSTEMVSVFDPIKRVDHCLTSGDLTGSNSLISFFGSNGSVLSNEIHSYTGSSWTPLYSVETLAPRSKVACSAVRTTAGTSFYAFGGADKFGIPMNEVIFVSSYGDVSVLSTMGRPSLLPSAVQGAIAIGFNGDSTGKLVTLGGFEYDVNIPSPFARSLVLEDDDASMTGAMVACPNFGNLDGRYNTTVENWIQEVSRCQSAAMMYTSPQREIEQCACVSEANMKLADYAVANPSCDEAMVETLRTSSWLENAACSAGAPSSCINFFAPAHASLSHCAVAANSSEALCSCVESNFAQVFPMSSATFQACPGYEHYIMESQCTPMPPSCFTNRDDAVDHCRASRGSFGFTCEFGSNVTCPEGHIYDGGNRGCVQMCAYVNNPQ